MFRANLRLGMLLLTVSGFGVGLPGVAAASSSKVAPAFNDRELSLPAAVMRFDAGARWPEYDSQLKHVVTPGQDLDFLNPGLSFGLTDEFDLGFVTPIRLSPDADLEDPRLHLLYQFFRSRAFEAGVFAQFRLSFDGNPGLLGGVPLYWRPASNVRLDAGGFMRVTFGQDSHADLSFPVQLPIQITDQLYAGPESGMNFWRLGDGTDLSVPLGGFVGYTLGSGAPVGDIYARMRILNLENGFDVVELMFGTELFWDL